MKFGDEKTTSLLKWMETDPAMERVNLNGRGRKEVNGGWEAEDPNFGAGISKPLAEMVRKNNVLVELKIDSLFHS